MRDLLRHRMAAAFRILLRLPKPAVATMLGALLAVELLARLLGRTRLTDCLGLALLATAATTIAWCRRWRLTHCRVWLSDLYRRHKLTIGVDLRLTPPVNTQTPDVLLVAVGLPTAALLTQLVLALGWQINLLSLLRTYWYGGYLLAITALWCALVLCLMIGLMLPPVVFHDWCAMRRPRGTVGRCRLEVLLTVVTFGALLAAGLLLPLFVPVLVMVAFLGVLQVLLARTRRDNDFRLLWQRASRPVRAVAGADFVLGANAPIVLIAVNLVLLATGSGCLGQDALARSSQTPLTFMLGVITAWCVSAAFAFCWFNPRFALFSMVRNRPSTEGLPIVNVDRAPAGMRHDIRCALYESGFRCRFSRRRRRTDVSIVIDAQADSQPPYFWPLRVAPDHLESPALAELLSRRDELQKRRLLVQGLAQLFKWAAAGHFQRGHGFWVAPQYWFLPGMTRDEEETEVDTQQGTLIAGIIGPPYFQLFPPSVRHYFYRLSRALEIDLLFVEDGVGFRRFRRVLNIMFEHYDQFAGSRTAQPVHFTGLPGVRVMIHDFDFDQPFKAAKYPEPDYEDVGRARVLHVFKDRGGDDERIFTPSIPADDRLPVFLLS